MRRYRLCGRENIVSATHLPWGYCARGPLDRIASHNPRPRSLSCSRCDQPRQPGRSGYCKSCHRDYCRDLRARKRSEFGFAMCAGLIDGWLGAVS